MMWRSLSTLAVSWSIVLSPAHAKERRSHVERTTQILVMGAVVSRTTGVAVPDNAGAGARSAPGGGAAEVQREMMSAFASASTEPQAFSSVREQGKRGMAVPVPSWMEAVGSGTLRNEERLRCQGEVYRPTTFLSANAEARREIYYRMMSVAACEHNIPTGLLDALIIQESGYNAFAVSPKDAFGLSQLMQATANSLGVNRYDAMENLRGGARYLRMQLDRFGQVPLALAAYNAGPARLHGAVPNFPETRVYVSSVLGYWAKLAEAPISSRGKVQGFGGVYLVSF